MGLELHDDDRMQYARLVEKYKSKENGAISASAQSPPASGPPLPSQDQQGLSGKGTDVDMGLCAECDSSGKVTEIYNHRRLERSCPLCDGRGATFYKNGQILQETKSAPKANGPQPVFTTSTAKQNKGRAAVEAKMEEYKKELAALDAASSMDPEEEVLRQQLQKQLVNQIERLTERNGP